MTIPIAPTTAPSIVNSVAISRSAPPKPFPFVPRPNLVDAISRIFETGADTVTLIDTPGYGRTTLLRDFVEVHATSSVSVFIRPASQWGYSPQAVLFDLANQITWILSGNELAETTDPDMQMLTHLYTTLQRRSRDIPFYFVIDGLDEIPAHGIDLYSAILSLLPFGPRKFRFLFTGQTTHSDLKERYPNLQHQVFTIPGFSASEVRPLFLDLHRTEPDVAEITRVTKGVPQKLVLIRRLLEKGMDLTQILSHPAETAADLYSLDWSTVTGMPEPILDALAIMACDDNPRTATDLASIVAVDENALCLHVHQLRFVERCVSTNTLQFESATCRSFVNSQLRGRIPKAQERLIDWLMKVSSDPSGLTQLPTVLRSAGRFRDLLQYLTPDRLLLIVGLHQSLLPLGQVVLGGLDAALRTGDHEALVRFSLNGALVKELTCASATESRVRAYLALNDEAVARSLATSAPLREDRLHLLAIVARSRVERGLLPDPETIEALDQLSSEVDPAHLGERAVAIAEDLIYTRPETAVSFVEKATRTNDSMTADLAMLRLFIGAASLDSVESALAVTATESAQSRIQNPGLQSLAGALKLLVRHTPADRIVAEVSAMKNFRAQLCFLIAWTDLHQTDPAAGAVIVFALDLIVRHGEYTTTAADVRQLTAPVRSISDAETIAKIVGRIDGLKGTLEKFGPTTEYIRLQIRIAEAQAATNNVTAAIERLNDTYLFVTQEKDATIRAECAAWILAFSSREGLLQSALAKDGITELAGAELESAVERILSDTASHHVHVKGVMRALAPTLFDKAIAIAGKLNTKHRRASAAYYIVDGLCRSKSQSLSHQDLAQALQLLEDGPLRDKAIARIVDALVARDFVSADADAFASWLVRTLPTVDDAAERCRLSARFLAFITSTPPQVNQSVEQSLNSLVGDSCRAVDAEWRRVELGYQVAAALAADRPDTAREFLTHSEQLETNQRTMTESAASALISVLALASAAAGGLVKQKLITQQDLDRLGRVVERLPSYGEQAALWADLAERLHLGGDSSGAKKIVDEKVRPLFSQICEGDKSYRWDILRRVSPSLFSASSIIALQEIRKAPGHVRDRCLTAIGEFIAFKSPTREPFDPIIDQRLDISLTDAHELLTLAMDAEADFSTAWFIRVVADSVDRGNAHKLTREQRQDLARRIDEVASKKFPAPGYLAHAGFTVFASIEAERVRQSKGAAFDQVYKTIASIPNAADRALLLSFLSQWCGNKDSKLRAKVIEEAIGLSKSLPTAYERAWHLESVAEQLHGVNRKQCIDTLRDVMQEAVSPESGAAGSAICRRAIDFAYKFDPTVATDLARMLDDDPARWQQRLGAQQQLRILETRRTLTDRRARKAGSTPKEGKAAGRDESPEVEEIAQAAWRSVGAMNAKHVPGARLKELENELAKAAAGRLSQCFPVFLWAIRSVAEMYSDTREAQSLTKGIFDLCLRSCEIAARLAERDRFAFRPDTASSVATESTSIISRPGDRNRMEAELCKWLDECASSMVLICDPYFGPNDLYVLKWIRQLDREIDVRILTGAKPHQGIDGSVKDEYERVWRSQIASVSPPATEIAIVYLDNPQKSAPIHDRWWLTDGSGLRIGTSINSLGESRISEISQLTAEEAAARIAEVDEFFYRRKRMFRGERLHYEIFTL